MAVRLHRQDLDLAGVAEGDLIRIAIVKVTKRGKVDLSDLPTGSDPDPRASVRHDEYLYG